jgi:hypothetical protein
LVIDSIEALVENWFNDASKVRTAHWSGHFLVPLKLR